MSSSLVHRPTVGLALIIKNEIKNLPRLLESVSECFDNIHITDTGSTDGSVEWLMENGAKAAKCPVYVHHFKWCNDFAKARNFAFDQVFDDFVMWLDADDSLHNREGFIHWRNHAMEFSDMAFATYHYALDKDMKPIISFVRERVFRKSRNPTWQFPIHEGVIFDNTWTRDYATTWAVNHLRDAEDVAADKSRNLKILEDLKASGDLVPRLQFYYAKELYEQGFPYKAIDEFELALKQDKLEAHDKMLSFQYGAYSAIACADQLKDEFRDQKNNYFTKALEFCLEGVKFNPHRAELWSLVGDLYIKMGDMPKAIPFYSAAKGCINPKDSGSPYEGAIYSFVDTYGIVPTIQLAKIYFNIGKLEDAYEQAYEAFIKYQSDEAKSILAELERIKQVTTLDNNQEEVNEIVITCPPHQAYPFDEEIYKTQALGGSETALVQMARYLKELTGLAVKVFNSRETNLVADSGVEYLSNKDLPTYFSKHKPRVHIAWRHNIELTKAKTYLWCHDLVTPTVETVRNFDSILCLTEFHKNYVIARQGVPSEEIIVTRNGLTPAKFDFERPEKNPNKIVWMSSPDRGLINCIPMLDMVRQTHPNIELHIYYGLENLYKYGLAGLADQLKQMISERPWIKYHGFTEQSKMYKEVADAVIWCHPANFIETFCITAIEMLALGIFPVTRRLGALQNTLAEAEQDQMAVLLSHDCVTDEERKEWASQVKKALDRKAWEHIKFDISKHDWKQIAKEWIEFMDLNDESPA